MVFCYYLLPIMPKQHPLNTALLIAEKAKQYARTQIEKGGTQLENNILESEYFDALMSGINSSRFEQGITEETGPIGIRNEIAQQKRRDFLESNHTLSTYENTILVTGKYSLGNCEELAHQAFDYVLNLKSVEIEAEVYSIAGGDHVFVVLNRPPASYPYDPENWEDAVICDPWADQVYPAKEYLSKLKNYYHDHTEKKNRLENFDSCRHCVVPTENMSISVMRSLRAENITTTRQLYADQVKTICGLLNYCAKKIEELSQPINDTKIKLQLLEFINHIKKILDYVNQKSESLIRIDDSNIDYRAAKAEFYQSLANFIVIAKKCLRSPPQFSNEHFGNLFLKLKLLLNDIQAELNDFPSYPMTAYMQHYKTDELFHLSKTPKTT